MIELKRILYTVHYCLTMADVNSVLIGQNMKAIMFIENISRWQILSKITICVCLNEQQHVLNTVF